MFYWQIRYGLQEDELPVLLHDVTWLHYAIAPPHFSRQVTTSNTANDIVGLVVEETWLDFLFTESHFR
jgi:hypothetical protein